MLYCVGHMEQDHSDSERGNPLPPAVCALGVVHICGGGGGGGVNVHIRRALQQLALNVHVKHSDMTCTFRARWYSTRLSQAHTPVRL